MKSPWALKSQGDFLFLSLEDKSQNNYHGDIIIETQNDGHRVSKDDLLSTIPRNKFNTITHCDFSVKSPNDVYLKIIMKLIKYTASFVHCNDCDTYDVKVTLHWQVISLSLEYSQSTKLAFCVYWLTFDHQCVCPLSR